MIVTVKMDDGGSEESLLGVADCGEQVGGDAPVEAAHHEPQTVAFLLAERDGRLQHAPPLLADLDPRLHVGQHVLVVVARQAHAPTQLPLPQLAKPILQPALQQLPIHLETHFQRPYLLAPDHPQQQSLSTDSPALAALLQVPQQPPALLVLPDRVVADQLGLQAAQLGLQVGDGIVVARVVQEGTRGQQELGHRLGVELPHHRVDGLQTDAAQLGQLQRSHQPVVGQALSELPLECPLALLPQQRLELAQPRPLSHHCLHQSQRPPHVDCVAVVVEVAHHRLHSQLPLRHQVLHRAEVLLRSGQVARQSTASLLSRPRTGLPQRPIRPRRTLTVASRPAFEQAERVWVGVCGAEGGAVEFVAVEWGLGVVVEVLLVLVLRVGLGGGEVGGGEAVLGGGGQQHSEAVGLPRAHRVALRHHLHELVHVPLGQVQLLHQQEHQLQQLGRVRAVPRLQLLLGETGLARRAVRAHGVGEPPQHQQEGDHVLAAEDRLPHQQHLVALLLRLPAPLAHLHPPHEPQTVPRVRLQTRHPTQQLTLPADPRERQSVEELTRVQRLAAVLGGRNSTCLARSGNRTSSSRSEWQLLRGRSSSHRSILTFII